MGKQLQLEVERKTQSRPAADDSRKSLAETLPAAPAEAHGPETGLPEGIFASRYPLAVLSLATLDSLPTAQKLSAQERRIVADALEIAVLQWLRKILQPEEVIREGSTWRASCRKGHAVRQAIFVRQLVGWCCEECQQVYPASECRLRIGERQ